MAVPVKSEVGSPDRKLPFDCSDVIEPRRCLLCQNFETHKLVELKGHFKADHAQSEENCSWQTNLDCLHLKDHDYCRFEPVLNEKNTERTDRTKIQWFQCGHCPYRTQKMFHLITHYDHVHQIQISHNTQLKCHICEFETKSQHTLKRHISQKHADSRHVPSSYILNDHDYFSPPAVLYNQTELFQCRHCPYSSTSRKNLKLHILRKHPDPTEIHRFECDYCPFKTPRKRSLYAHYDAKHPTKLELECDFCQFKTKFRFTLKSHILEHYPGGDDVQWFDCEQCAYSSIQKKILEEHVYYSHTRKRI